MSQTPKSKGHKADAGKRRMDLIPSYPLRCLADVLTFGSHKYTDNNWRHGVKWSRDYAATLRHLDAFWSGEDLDPESGLPHLAHAICDIVFLLEYTKTHPELDDRWSTIQKKSKSRKKR